MKSNTFWKVNTIAAAIIAGSTALPTVAFAADEALEEVVVVISSKTSLTSFIHTN